jgi:branched-chain amino acid transport system ATP-binding protein
MHPLLKVNSICVFYGDLQVLWNVSFEVEESEVVALVGSNGAGKTTTLRTISGLLRPKTGSISFMGRDLHKLPPHRIAEYIAHVPEGRHLFPYMTVRKNLEMGAYTPKARKDLKSSLAWVYNIFPVLKERENQLAGTLSGGEQQMLVIARGLMSKPKLLMLDEPSLGLGPKIISLILKTIESLREEGITILLVEQNIFQSLKISDRAYVLENGRITLQGSAKELLSNRYIREAYLGI